ncbi:MAG: NUDIX domain-containing protein [Planktomarina temperata]|nr:NUDIX domain-containing protein [Planktomarina temperata]
MKVGAIAYRNNANGVELCFVSSRRHKGAITLPKGIVKPNEQLAKAATRELFEEAGVTGKVKRKSYPLFFTSNTIGIEDILYFFVKITAVQENWPEANHRNRVFLTVNEASSRATSQGTREVLNCLMREHTEAVEGPRSNTFNIPILPRFLWLKKFHLLENKNN